MEERHRLLIVDDEPRIGQLLTDLLSREGYTVDSCLTGGDALNMLRGDIYDMVISDLKMPGMDGFELIESIRAEQPDVLKVMMTGYATVETAVQALKHGADDYVTKPFDVDELRKVVGRLLETRRLARENQELLERIRQQASAGAKDVSPVQPKDFSLLLECKIAQSHAINQISQTITALLDLEDMLGACLGLVNQEMHVERSSIMLVEGSGTHLVVRAVEGAGNDLLGKRQRVGERISGWVAQRKESLLIEDIGNHRHFRADSTRYKSKSLLSVPVMYQGRLMGVMNLTDKRENRAFTEDDREFLETVAGQLAVAIENARLYAELKANSLNAVSALAQSMEARAAFTAGHSERVAEQSVRIAQQLGLSTDSQTMLRSAALLHDIGKIGISEVILLKPEQLDSDEQLIVRIHPEAGERIIQSLGFLDRVSLIVRHHHERWDGGGYPDGLRGEEIPFITRIMSLVDAYDAMTSERPYRAARSSEEAVSEIERCAGTQFDPQMVEVFKRAI